MNDSNSTSVIDVQNRLIRLGYDIPAQELGKIGPETVRFITIYQEIHGLDYYMNVSQHFEATT